MTNLQRDIEAAFDAYTSVDADSTDYQVEEVALTESNVWRVARVTAAIAFVIVSLSFCAVMLFFLQVGDVLISSLAGAAFYITIWIAARFARLEYVH